MPFDTFEKDKPYLLAKFQEPQFEAETGLGNDVIKAHISVLADEMEPASHRLIKAKAFEYVTRNVRIDVNPHDWFVGFACWDRNDRLLGPLLQRWGDEINRTRLSTTCLSENIRDSGAVAMWPDFDHSVPDWDAVLSLGFCGLRERARGYRLAREKVGPLTDEEQTYFEGIDITYGAVLEMLERFYRYAVGHADGQARVQAVAECLQGLILGKPRNTFEALQVIYLFFIFSEHIDHMQVRSMGNLDRVLYPFYRSDLDRGTFTKAQIREWIDYFLMQYASINNYWGHPFYLGGTKADGSSEINELSYLILDAFDKLNITSPKIQLKVMPNTPVAFLDKALDMVRRNNSSLVFVSEIAIRRAMMGVGCSEEEARTCDITGCYEYAVRAREVQTAPIYLNLLKPIELVLHNGIDPITNIECGCRTGELGTIQTFDDFYGATYTSNISEGTPSRTAWCGYPGHHVRQNV